MVLVTPSRMDGVEGSVRGASLISEAMAACVVLAPFLLVG